MKFNEYPIDAHVFRYHMVYIGIAQPRAWQSVMRPPPGAVSGKWGWDDFCEKKVAKFVIDRNHPIPIDKNTRS